VHDLENLLKKPDLSQVYDHLKKRFDEEYNGHDKGKGFEYLLHEARNLFEGERYHFEPNQNRYVNSEFTSFIVDELRQFLRKLP